MTTLRYATRGRWFSSGGDCLVTDGDHEVATVVVEPGWFLRGPCWDWRGPFGPEWTLTALRSDRLYEVTRADGLRLGELSRPLLTSSMQLSGADGSTATVASRPFFGRSRDVALPGGRVASVVRETSSFTLTSAETWTLELPDDLGDPLRTLVLALPLVLDHQRRRAESQGVVAGSSS